MTVYAPTPKISKKVTIPIIIVFFTLGVGIWFLPMYGFWMEGGLARYFVNGSVSFSCLVFIGMVLAWATWDGTE